MSRGTARNQRGKGYTAPVRPASGPVEMRQPVRPEANSGIYGDRKAAVQQQQSAPMRAGGVAAPDASGVQAAMGGEAIPTPIDPFGPSNRPNEAVTQGAFLGAGGGGPTARETATDLARALFEMNPYDDTLRDLLEELSG